MHVYGCIYTCIHNYTYVFALIMWYIYISFCFLRLIFCNVIINNLLNKLNVYLKSYFIFFQISLFKLEKKLA